MQKNTKKFEKVQKGLQKIWKKIFRVKRRRGAKGRGRGQACCALLEGVSGRLRRSDDLFCFYRILRIGTNH